MLDENKLIKLFRTANNVILVLSYIWVFYSIGSFLVRPNLIILFFRLLLIAARYFFIPLDRGVEDSLPDWISRNAVVASYLKYMIILRPDSMIGKTYLMLNRMLPGILAKFIVKIFGFVVGSMRLIANGYATMIYQTLFSYRDRKRYDSDAESIDEAISDDELARILTESEFKEFQEINEQTLLKISSKDNGKHDNNNYKLFKKYSKAAPLYSLKVQRYIFREDPTKLQEVYSDEDFVRANNNMLMIAYLDKTGKVKYKSIKDRRGE